MKDNWQICGCNEDPSLSTDRLVCRTDLGNKIDERKPPGVRTNI